MTVQELRDKCNEALELTYDGENKVSLNGVLVLCDGIPDTKRLTDVRLEGDPFKSVWFVLEIE